MARVGRDGLGEPGLIMDTAAELRALQARAYAPGGGLSPAEAARLHELQEQRRRSDAAAPLPAASDTAASDREKDNGPREGLFAANPPYAEPSSFSGAGAGAGSDDGADATQPRRIRPLHLALGAALLVAGIGIGWGVGPPSPTCRRG